MIKILRNAIKCNHCGDVIESTSRHQFATCSCGCCRVAGELEYLRRCFKHSREEDYTDLSENIEEDKLIFEPFSGLFARSQVVIMQLNGGEFNNSPP